jgi:ubiquinol-cytochrome c reductase cytochrome b subunit
LIADTERCAQCHRFHADNEDAYAPDLTRYMSREWLIDFISNPAHPRFYGEENDRMPAFAAGPDTNEESLLDRRSIELIVDWLRQEWWEPSDAP